MFRHLAEQALEQMPGIMFVIDGRWELLRWNRNLEYLTGYSEEKLHCLPALDLIAPEDRIMVASAMRLAFDVGRASVEARILTSAGRHVSHFFSGSVAQIEGKSCIIGVGLDISERLALEERLRALSRSDELTGLLNRRGFFDEGRRRVLGAQRGGLPVSLFFADLDGLKDINDHLGHRAGDEALRRTAGALRRSFRESDVVARLGGDEFAALAVDAQGQRDLVALRQRIHDHLAPAPGGLGLGLSLGVATCAAGVFCSLEEMVSRADRDMYRDKNLRRRGPASELAQ